MQCERNCPVTDTCIVVLGMHRTGTSLVAGLLRRLGVNMGTTFRKPDRHNDMGYFEDLDWRNLNKALINDAGGRWFNPPNVEDVDNVLDLSRVEALVNARSGLWGFKDPRTTFTIHALEPYLPNLHIVRVSRNPLDIIRSLATRAAIMGYHRSDVHWYTIIRRYEERIQMYLHDFREPILSIGYEKLLYRDSAQKCMERLAEFCGLDWKDDGLLDYAMELIRFRECT